MRPPAILRICCFLLLLVLTEAFAQDPSAGSPDRSLPEQWRNERRIIDLHLHLDGSRGGLARAAAIMDRVGLGIGANLSGGTVTAKAGQKSAFEKTKTLADGLHPGRFVHYMNLDYAGWDEPDFSERAARQIEEGHRLGAAGLKE